MATQEACEDDVCPFCQIANKQTDTEILFSVSVECSLSSILVVVAVIIIINNIINKDFSYYYDYYHYC